MARRSGRKGSYLMTDDYTGFTHYASDLKLDYWGSYAKSPLLRNLQEISSPLNDPQPVIIYRGPDYEYTRPCIGEIAPEFIGNTTVKTKPTNAAFYALNLNPSLGQMQIGCTFRVF